VKKLANTCKSERDFMKSLRGINKTYHIHLDLLYTHGVHAAAETNDLRLMEHLMSSIKDREKVVNQPLGKHDYTPLCRAAFAGSIDMLKLLVSVGADVCFKNVHGEDIQTCLNEGCTHMVEKMKSNAIFIRPRYEECRTFIARRKKWIEDQKIRAAAPKSKPFRPSRVVRSEAATKIKRWWLSIVRRRRRAKVRKAAVA